MNSSSKLNQKTNRRLSETFVFAGGFLVGGFIGLGCGFWAGGEFSVIIGYAVGAILGAYAAGYFFRWITRKDLSNEDSDQNQD